MMEALKRNSGKERVRIAIWQGYLFWLVVENEALAETIIDDTNCDANGSFEGKKIIAAAVAVVVFVVVVRFILFLFYCILVLVPGTVKECTRCRSDLCMTVDSVPPTKTAKSALYSI